MFFFPSVRHVQSQNSGQPACSHCQMKGTESEKKKVDGGKSILGATTETHLCLLYPPTSTFTSLGCSYNRYEDLDVECLSNLEEPTMREPEKPSSSIKSVSQRKKMVLFVNYTPSRELNT